MRHLVLFFLLLSPLFIYSQKDKIIDQDVPTKDIPHYDDVIIFGSLNVGLDAILDREFDFDTQIFSENNLRVYFEDTSTAASFPSNDWRVVINDSADGGENYYSIEDVTGAQSKVFKIEAGARSNSLVVNSNSNIGIGTANPAVQAHMVKGDTPTLRLDQDNTSGFTPQVWDIAGNERNFFIRDVTHTNRLPFRIRPNAQTSSIDIMDGVIEINGASTNTDTNIKGENDNMLVFVDASADMLGIGTDNPTSKLHVVGDIAKTGSLIGVSDARIKNDISSITNALSIINHLDGKTFEFDNSNFPELVLPVGKQFGLIAQEVQEASGLLVKDNFMNVSNTKGEKFSLKGVKYEQIIPILINAIKEQNQIIQEYKVITENTNERLALVEKKLFENSVEKASLNTKTKQSFEE